VGAAIMLDYDKKGIHHVQNQSIAYTKEQIKYIKQVLIKSDETIKFLQKNLTENNIESPH
jgi:hypothetical protein